MYSRRAAWGGLGACRAHREGGPGSGAHGTLQQPTVRGPQGLDQPPFRASASLVSLADGPPRGGHSLGTRDVRCRTRLPSSTTSAGTTSTVSMHAWHEWGPVSTSLAWSSWVGVTLFSPPLPLHPPNHRIRRSLHRGRALRSGVAADRGVGASVGHSQEEEGSPPSINLFWVSLTPGTTFLPPLLPRSAPSACLCVVQGYSHPEVALNCGAMLRECIRHEKVR